MQNVGKVLLAAALALSGCWGGDGMIVGFVVDGQSGQRVNFFDADGRQKNVSDNSDSTKQIWALIDGEVVRAVPCDTGDATDTNRIALDGCFRIKGVPYGAEVPVFVQHNDYERFHGRVIYPTESSETGQLVANIRVFPRNFQVDYRVLVHLDGRPVNDVAVNCQIRQGSNTMKTDGHFIDPENTVSAAISVRSGGDFGDGLAVIAGTDLVLGASYHCEAFRQDLYESRGILTGQKDFVAGVDPSDLSIDLKAENAADSDLIYALWSNADNPTDMLGNNAQLKITMNRPVEIVPLTGPCQGYSIHWPGDINKNGNTEPVPPQQSPENQISAQVATSVSPDGLTVTIAYKQPNPQLDPGDSGTTISFDGIYLRPKGDARIDGTVVRRLGGAGSCSGAGGVAKNSKPLKNMRTGDQTDTISLF